MVGGGNRFSGHFPKGKGKPGETKPNKARSKEYTFNTPSSPRTKIISKSNRPTRISRQVYDQFSEEDIFKDSGRETPSGKVWYVIPSANPALAQKTLARWRQMGYKTAVLLDKGSPSIDADLVLHGVYEGYFKSVNRLCQLVIREADIVVTGGDDVLPDPKKMASEIAKEFLEKFSDRFGIMQPIGDSLLGTDRVCGSPWIGKEWVTSSYGGAGPFFGKYFQFYGDEELFRISEKLGILWQRSDLTQFHNHWMRPGGPRKTAYQTKNDQWWVQDRDLFTRRQDAGFPNHERAAIK